MRRLCRCLRCARSASGLCNRSKIEVILDNPLSFKKCFISSISLYTDFELYNVTEEQIVVIDGNIWCNQWFLALLSTLVLSLLQWLFILHSLVLQWILHSYFYTHSLCFAINQVLGSALSLAYLFQIIIILQDSSLLQPSYYYHLSNLYITCITSFVPLSCILYLFMYPYTQQNTFIFYRRFKSMPPISFPLLIYSHLYSSLQSSILPT